MRFATISLGIAIAALVACAPIISQRGYIADPALENSIKTGTDTRTTVQERLGYASTTATFGGDNVWYYISSTEKQVAFFTPTVLDRKILAVSFDREGAVTNLRRFSLRDGRVVTPDPRETPARGRELTFLQQLLNARPGASAQDIGNTNPGGGPVGGGGGLP